MTVFISDSRHPERLRGAPAYRAACMRRLSSFSHFCEPPSGHEPRALLPRARLVSSWRHSKQYERNPKGKNNRIRRPTISCMRHVPAELLESRPENEKQGNTHTADVTAQDGISPSFSLHRGAPAVRAACMRSLSSFSRVRTPPRGHEPCARTQRTRLVPPWRQANKYKRETRKERTTNSQHLMHTARTRGAPLERAANHDHRNASCAVGFEERRRIVPHA